MLKNCRIGEVINQGRVIFFEQCSCIFCKQSDICTEEMFRITQNVIKTPRGCNVLCFEFIEFVRSVAGIFLTIP